MATTAKPMRKLNMRTLLQGTLGLGVPGLGDDSALIERKKGFLKKYF